MTGSGIAFVVVGYLSGSIPFSYLMGRAFGKKDIRLEGSGNVGATNVFRVAGRTAGVAAAAGDILKSLLPVLAARLAGLDPSWTAATAAAVIIGHCYPVWLRFSGGKGVNSTVAVFAVISWPALLVFGVVWLTCFFATRWVSLASLLHGDAPGCDLLLERGRQLPGPRPRDGSFHLLPSPRQHRAPPRRDGIADGRKVGITLPRATARGLSRSGRGRRPRNSSAAHRPSRLPPSLPLHRGGRGIGSRTPRR